MAARRKSPEYVDVPPEHIDRVRAAASALPECYEEQAWTGRRWMIRSRNFGHLYCLDGPNGPVTILQFRSSGPERDVLAHSGHPFVAPGDGFAVMLMVLDDATDWGEVAELLAESYCHVAPKKLIALLDRPDA